MGRRNWRVERQAKQNARVIGERLSERAVDQALGLSVALPLPATNVAPESEEKKMAEGFIVFARFTAGDRVHHRGDYLENAEGLALRPEIRDSYLRKALIPADWKPKPRMAVVPKPEPKRPTRDQVAALLSAPQSADAPRAWRELFTAMCKLTGGNAALAEDIILSDPAGSRLASLAVRVDAERRHAGSFMRPPRALREVGAA